ncbi:hypothetical protein R5W23_002562 [Gemmata sp. JC673]|uniref:Uncharacterized protein n=1 Tax=Gemmata algarum TaxID=2975278 RepID=A0ABU5F3J6_9BACT|nr:hypothetical protein [Gemmata algarum]MDY3561285.1 hypothetical protein [Gemmata algarum]
MAKCDEGYRCEVCGRDVEAVTDSDLYLRFVLGEVSLETLHLLPERHLRCNPALAQYIVDPAFAPVACDGPFAKAEMDAPFVTAEERRVSRGYRRLCAIPTLGLAVPEYPLSVTPDGGAD